MTRPLTAADLVTDARARIREVAPAAFAAAPGEAILVDVREPAEFETGHIPGAINIPRGVLEFQVDAHPAVARVSDPALSHKDRPLVLACRTGGRAALAADTLQRMGFSDVRSIAGGVTAWAEAGLPLVVR
ncbi:MAG TPA: rhodanese-like domain-containing protein [Thermomonas sp.]|nr:rhodanese-like domain-containing protein [Thermomonas sp.]